MKKLSPTFTRSRAFVFALLSFASAHAVSGPSKQVPFKADVSTIETLAIANSDNAPRCLLQPSFPPIAGMTVGVGNASHLGKIAFVATDCVIPNNGMFAFNNGQLTVTVANGDQLFISYSGTFGALQFGSPSEWPSLNIDPVQSTFTVTGGTGKFANATGAGSLSGQLKVNPNPLDPNATPSPGQLHLDGTISY